MRRKLGFLLLMGALAGVIGGCPSDDDDGLAEDGGLAGAGDGASGSGGGAGTESGGSGGTGGAGGTGGEAGGGTGGAPVIAGRTTGDKVDLLFMVDNSNTMREEQAALRAQFPRLIQALLDGVDLDGDGALEYEGARDVHLGVVSSDLGLPGISGVPNCADLGDNGELNGTASPEIPGCSASTFDPPFLTYVEGDDVAQTATDFACLATVGTEGCGFEQQLEAALKAVWPGNDPQLTFLPNVDGTGNTGNAGPGFPNGDFIRNDATDLSLVAVVLVTDEEDCSSRSLEHFVLPRSTAENTREALALNLRCYFETLKTDGGLFSAERYIQGFKKVREGSEQLVLFGAIVGVPPELVTREKLAAVDYDDPAAVDAFYDGILADPKMQYAIDDNQTPDELADDKLMTSCTKGAGAEAAEAYPPRRIVEVAKGFGRNGFVQSICEEDFVPAIDLIITRIAETFEPVIE